jgi:hypothetical protein
MPEPSYNVYDTNETERRRFKRRRIILLVALAVFIVFGVVLGGVLMSGEPSAPGDELTTTTATTVLTPPTVPLPSSEAGSGVAAAVTSATQEKILEADYAPINTSYAGLSMFRGNAHRTHYGEGPVPRDPVVMWRHGPMSGPSSEGGVQKIWSGTGWTGQPVVVEREGMTQVMFGAYDHAVHFLDAESGEPFLPPLKTGDIIKGSVMFDPDGYPLLYTGSRDNFFRVIALDRNPAEVLYKLNAADVPKPVWNNDWDSSPLVIGDYLFEGGENSYFYILKLNRGFDEDGRVTVKPKVVLAHPAYDQDLFAAIRDRNVSIENSPSVHLDLVRGDRVYFANSGGRVLGLDISALGLSKAGYGPGGQAPGTWEDGVRLPDASGGGAGYPAGSQKVRPVPDSLAELPENSEFPVVFKFWTGDDTDASVVIDEEGMLYVASEFERKLPQAKEVGQLMKLNPYDAENPLVWSVKDQASAGDAGIWATPALHGDMVYVPTHTGRLLGVDRHDGRIVWEVKTTFHAWSSPAVVDDTLIMGDTDGYLRAWDVSDPGQEPPELWNVKVGGAIESTVAVWRGRIFVGSRDGYFYCFGDASDRYDTNGDT